MIDGIGIDIVEIERVRRAVANARFRSRVFTETECSYCDAAPGGERYAGRFAAKEAVAKALGASVRWREVEIVNDAGGEPRARLTGRAAESLGGRKLLLSISHCRTFAVAQAVLCSRDGAAG